VLLRIIDGRQAGRLAFCDTLAVFPNVEKRIAHFVSGMMRANLVRKKLHAVILRQRSLIAVIVKIDSQARLERTELPLPDDLKAQQKEQITRLFEQVDIDQPQDREVSRAKSSKR
jgi:D-alanyl-D-alanine dipeptidase